MEKNNKSGLQIIIVGAGKVGKNLIETLTPEGHDITIIDRDSGKIQEITNLYDVMGITGNGASYTLLKEAGIDTADLLIAVTESDELNLLCCTIAKQVVNCASIARVRNPDYAEEVGYLREKLGLTMIINPELEAAKEMARILYLPTALEVNSFAQGQAEIVKFKIPEGNRLDGMTIMELGSSITNDILISAVERKKEVFIPGGKFTLQSGDIISVVGTQRTCRNFLHQIGFKTKAVKNSLIVGGGRSAYYLADQLIKAGISVKIIERNRERCEELSILLPKAIIINGDGADPELLKEEGMNGVESFVPLTGIDEENVILALHARAHSSAKLITKINRMGLSDVADSLDLGSVIYPKYITTETIIAYVRARKASLESNIETLYHMFDNQVEAIEFYVSEVSSITSKTLRELKLKNNLLIAFIFRGGKCIIPTGNDEINVGDRVMVFTKHKGFTDIKDILA